MPNHHQAGDLCTCGHRRDEHKPGRRPQWPLTSTRRGACTKACMCVAWDIDVERLLDAEAVQQVARAITAESDPRLHAIIYGTEKAEAYGIEVPS